MRLFSYVKIYGNYTKSEITKIYNEGKILINNNLVPLTCPVRNGDIVTIDNVILKNDIEFKYYLYYKPRGVLSMINDKPESFINYIDSDIKISPAGRLDKDSEGLMILTNDGKFIHKLMTPLNHEKEYIVELKYPVTSDFIDGMSKSYTLKDRVTTPMKVKRLDAFHLNLILYEGIYHQIRQIVKLNNNIVLKLKRIRIGKYSIDSMNPNEMKEFTPLE